VVGRVCKHERPRTHHLAAAAEHQASGSATLSSGRQCSVGMAWISGVGRRERRSGLGARNEPLDVVVHVNVLGLDEGTWREHKKTALPRAGLPAHA